MRTVPGDREDDADVRQSGTADGGQSSPTSGAARRQTRVVRWLRQARFRPGVGLPSVIRGRPRSGPGDSRLDAEDDARSSRSALGFDTRDALATASDMIAKERSHTRSVSRRTAFILVWAVGVPLGHGVGPWAISLLSPRYGWATSGPGIWNALGLMPIALGIAGLIWIMMVAFVEAPDRVELRQAPFLLTRGPYAYSRNPMYVSELALWLGWAVFYGSVGVLIGFVIFFAVFLPGARYEERALEARFGDAYRAYRGRVPRWLGTRRQREPHTSCREACEGHGNGSGSHISQPHGARLFRCVRSA